MPSPLFDNTGSFSPDMAEGIDTFKDQLLEAFANATKAQGDLKQALLRELAATLSCDSLGEMLRGLIAMHAAEERAEAVLHTIALIMDRDRPALTAECIAYAANLHTLNGGLSETEIAAKHSVCRAAVSQRVQDCKAALNLPPSRGMKDDEAVAVYSERQHRIHGTERDPEQEVSTRTTSVISSIDKILRWHAGASLQRLNDQQRNLLKAAFVRVKPVVEEVAKL